MNVVSLTTDFARGWMCRGLILAFRPTPRLAASPPTTTASRCGERRAAPHETCHQVERSGKPLRQYCRCGHVGATHAATIGCSSGPKDTRTTRDVPDTSGSESARNMSKHRQWHQERRDETIGERLDGTLALISGARQASFATGGSFASVSHGGPSRLATWMARCPVHTTTWRLR